MRECLYRVNRKRPKSTDPDVEKAKERISFVKNNLLSPDILDPKWFAIYNCYQFLLKQANAIDFDDLLVLSIELLRMSSVAREKVQSRWNYMLIDEYQDTNVAQYQMTKLLVEKHNNLFVVGDPDQSIYSWRGAQYKNIFNFEHDFPGAKVVALEQNYRSTNIILRAANSLIKKNGQRMDKSLWSALGEGELVRVVELDTEKKEARWIVSEIERHLKDNDVTSYNEVAILYRTNAQSRLFEDALMFSQLPYSIVKASSFYDRKEIRDVVSILRMLVSDNDFVAFERSVGIGASGFGDASVNRVLSCARNGNVFQCCLTGDIIGLGKKQQQALGEYVSKVLTLREMMPLLSVARLIEISIAKFNYLTVLKRTPETFVDRKENLDELVALAQEWSRSKESPTLSGFLEDLSLRSGAAENSNIPTIKLMTLHSSKGLEFDLVFIAGVEEGLMPHAASLGKDAYRIDEERRLCYVGMTRAKRLLCLSHVKMRTINVKASKRNPSRFLAEIPESCVRKSRIISR